MRQRKQMQQAAATKFGKSLSMVGDRSIKCSLLFLYDKPESGDLNKNFNAILCMEVATELQTKAVSR